MTITPREIEDRIPRKEAIMARGKPTPMERLVGRPCPPHPRHIDTVMAAHVAPDGQMVGRFRPAERWLAPAHLKARRQGWLRAGVSISFCGRRPEPIWYLTQTGEAQARAARLRVDAAVAARRE